jgi:septal ring factor EnvC (AmiA/AmiB activator)
VVLLAACYSRVVDVERTIELILRTQARSEARVDALEKRLDRRMDAITKLLHQGMRMIVQIDTKVAELAKSQAELAKSQKELAAAQKATERTLKALIDSLRNGRNGR